MRKKDNRSYNLIQNSIIFGLGIAIISGAITTIIIGFNLNFLLSLLAGIFLGSANIVIFDKINKKAIDNGKVFTVVLSGQIRLILFAVLFYFAITRLGFLGGLGAGIGFFASYLGIMIASALMQKKNNIVYKKSKQVEYVNGMPRNILIKDFEMVKHFNGKTFITHRIFNKREVAQNG
jgi:hypothetical protein